MPAVANYYTIRPRSLFFFFFFNESATPEIYPLSLPDALPIFACDPSALADRQRHVLEHAQAAEQRVDLEGAGEPALHPARLGQRRHVLAAEQDTAAAGCQIGRAHV